MKIRVEVEVPDQFCNACQFEYEQECSLFNKWLEAVPVRSLSVYNHYLKLPECTAAEVKEDEDRRLQEWAVLIHYPDCWDTINYPRIEDAITESLGFTGCSMCMEAEDA